MSSYTEGQTHQLVNALEAAGFTAADITALGQFKLATLLPVVHGYAKVVCDPDLVVSRISQILAYAKTDCPACVRDHDYRADQAGKVASLLLEVGIDPQLVIVSSAGGYALYRSSSDRSGWYWNCCNTDDFLDSIKKAMEEKQASK